jgi:phosphoribosylformylglycinamidine synthase
MAFRHEGDVIVLLDGQRNDTPHALEVPSVDDARREFSSSEYAFALHNITAGAPPVVNLAAEKLLIEFLVACAAENLLRSAHDVSDGGLAVTLAESCFASDGLSAEISLNSHKPAEVTLFGERGARAIVSVSPEKLARFRSLAREYELGIHDIGRVTRGDFQIKVNGRDAISAPCNKLREAWSGSFPALMAG